MAKSTFNNLDEEKKNKIYDKLKTFFEESEFDEVNVSSIVKTLDIARGSFYQYFDDIDDCYFTVLKKETGHIHHKFFDLWENNNRDTEKTLYLYRDFLKAELYDKNLMRLYRLKFFVFENSTMGKGKNFLSKYLNQDETEFVLYIMAVFHLLIKESILENYDKDKFTELSDKYINLLLGGIKNAGF